MASLADKKEFPLADASVTPELWGNFLCTIFDDWVRHDVGKNFVEIFDCTLANWMGVLPGICAYSKECGHAGVMEHNGDVYSCDHFVFPEYKLGNIKDQSLIDMLYGKNSRNLAVSSIHLFLANAKNVIWSLPVMVNALKTVSRKISLVNQA